MVTGIEKYNKKGNPKYTRTVRLMGACHIALGAACLGAYPGVGTYHSIRKNSSLGAYLGVGACPGYYSIYTKVVRSP